MSGSVDMRSPAVFLVPLLFVIMTSGCTVPGLGIELPIDIPGITDVIDTGVPSAFGTEHDVIVIKSLEASPAVLDLGQTTEITAYIENRGDISRVVMVKLYDYCSDVFTLVRGRAYEINVLPGEIYSVPFYLKAKEDVKLKTVCPPDGVKVSATYPYTTSSLTTISFISEDELERTLTERAYKPEESYITLGKGPIKPVITVEDKQPVPVFKGGRTTVALRLVNMGSGEIAEENKIDWSNILVDMGDLNFKKTDDCGFGSGDSMKFIGKSTAKIHCGIDLTRVTVKTTATKNLQAQVFHYLYSVKKSVPVTVDPKIIS